MLAHQGLWESGVFRCNGRDCREQATPADEIKTRRLASRSKLTFPRDHDNKTQTINFTLLIVLNIYNHNLYFIYIKRFNLSI